MKLVKSSSKIFLVKYFYWPFQGGTSFVDHLCYFCLVFVMLLPTFIAALWSPEGKELTSWLLFVMFIVILLLSHLASSDRCGTWLYRFRSFLSFLLLKSKSTIFQSCWDSSQREKARIWSTKRPHPNFLKWSKFHPANRASIWKQQHSKVGLQWTVYDIVIKGSVNMCIGHPKEPFHWDGSLVYLQHILGLEHKKINFSITLSYL